MTTQSDREKNWDNQLEPRIKFLREEGLYLEAFYLYAATIEHALQINISHHEDWIEHVLKRSSIQFKKYTIERLREKTLGQLIELFSRYHGDARLISELHAFNSFRKKIIHHILDHTIEQLDSEAKSRDIPYYRLVAKLYRLSYKLSTKFLRVYKRKLSRARASTSRTH